MAIVDFSNAFDQVIRTKLCDILGNRGTPDHLMKAIKSIYRRPIKEFDTVYCMSLLFNIYIADIISDGKKPP